MLAKIIDIFTPVEKKITGHLVRLDSLHNLVEPEFRSLGFASTVGSVVRF